jgi:peroxiredoxin
MKCLPFLLLITLSFAAKSFAVVPETEFTGTFDSKLIVQTADFWNVELMSPKEAAKVRFALKPGASDTVLAGYLYNPFLDRLEMLFALVSPAGGGVNLWVDVNHNKQLDANEQFELVEDGRPNRARALIEIPMNDGRFNSFPMLVGFSKSGNHLSIWQTKFATVLGTVNIKDRSVRVAYTYNPLTKSVFFNQRWWGIDANGDGQVDLSRMSVEAAFSINESRILKVRDTYVSTKRTDLAKNEIILTDHPAGDYKRVDLSLGAEMPDFVFAGLGQNKRHLAEFRGNYVLLYIWGPLCDSCYVDFGYMKEYYSDFHHRGFEIIGLYISTMNEHEIDAVHANFTMVAEPSISAWVKQLYLSAYPIAILLDRNGKIISRGLSGERELGLRGAELSETLKKILP